MPSVRRPEWRVLLGDVLLAIALGVLILAVTRFAALNQVPFRTPPDALGIALLVVTAAALSTRRIWPLSTLVVVSGALTTYLALHYSYGPVFLTLAVAVYTVAARLPVRQSALACGIALAVVLVGHSAVMGWSAVLTNLTPMMLFGTGFVVAPWAIGTAVRQHRESGARAHEDETRRRAYEERLRVVQEVHDVVGHGLSAINLQSGVALHVLDQRPEHARPALEAIRQTSKDALDELRSTLAVFRTDEPTHDRGPRPGLDQLDALATRLEHAGLPVSISVTGAVRDRPAAVDLAAYRIVQESLTNVLRHAGQASATVEVRHETDSVEILITDDGQGGRVDPAESPGQGIVGMHHRATAVGGTLHAGPRAGGGFRVHARLPLAENPSPGNSPAGTPPPDEASAATPARKNSAGGQSATAQSADAQSTDAQSAPDEPSAGESS